jgi:hypothetical protein
LDGNQNNVITQFVNLNLVTLSLSYAARQGQSFETCQGRVFWNGVLVKSLVPKDFAIKSFAVTVIAASGINNLTISGAGTSDGLGLTIDNVALVKVGASANLVINGGFENPNTASWWQIYPGVAGWTSTEMEIGFGTIYNAAWTSQVCELDGNKNNSIFQLFSL